MRAVVPVLPLLIVMFVGECKAVPMEQGSAQAPAATADQAGERRSVQAVPQGSEAAQPAAAAPAGKTAKEEKDESVLVGPVTREKVEEAVPAWVQAEVEAAPEPAAVQALAAVPPGAEVTVFLGTWCGDSRRELSRLWRALDAAGGPVPFAISYVGVDHDKKEPAAAVGAAGVRYLPTLIVRRDGREVGRIVESAPHGVERDLLSLLDGSARGTISGRDDLGGVAPPGGDAPPPKP